MGLRELVKEGSSASSSENELLISEKLEFEEDTYDWTVNLNLLGKIGASITTLTYD
jgi:hypothetical protein